MQDNQSHLLKTKRFLPLFITQFFSAFNDNIYKNAMVILITFVISKGSPEHEQMMVTMAAGIFIMPFFLFSALAGQLADKFDKAKLSRTIKFFEIIITSIGSYGLYQQNIPILMGALFLMGVHSTFFGPIKYSILPDHLHEDELIGANAFIEASTFLAILIGTLVGGLLIITSHGVFLTSIVMLSIAIAGWVSSFYIPLAPAPRPNLKINKNLINETWNILKSATDNRDVFLAIMGISWFWLVGGSFLSQFPTFTKDVLHATAPVVSLFLAAFSIGIAIGSMACNRLLHGEINAKYIPLAIMAMSLFLGDVHFATNNLTFADDLPLLTVTQFLSHWHNWRVLIDFSLLSIAGGLYIVPLYAILQVRSEEHNRSRMIACNNIVNAFFMALASVIIIILLKLHLSITQIFLVVAIMNTFVAVYIAKLLPHVIVQSFAKWILVSLYRVKVKGLKNYKAVNGRMVIVANHTSFLDAMIISAFLPHKITFAVNTHIARKWWIKPLLALVNAFPIDPTKPMSTKSLIKAVKANKKILIFPEGRLTMTGSLMKIYEGPGMVADRGDAMILPIRIEGAQYSPFSRLRGKVRIRMFPKIRMTIMEPQKFEVPANIKGRARRQIISTKLYDLMSEMLFSSSSHKQHIFRSLIEAKHIQGGSHIIAEDIKRQPISYSQLITRSIILGRHLKKETKQKDVVGLLLPNMVSTLITFFALQAYSRTPAMLNYSAGINAVITACKTTRIKIIYTSKRFTTIAKLENMVTELRKAGIKIVFLEAAVQEIPLFTKLAGYLTSFNPKRHFDYYNRDIRSADPAVILFTSGSEGTPKGVVLSHKNVQANRFQMSARIDFSSQDVVFNALPMFHSFGLNAGTLLPVLSGVKTFLYPTPLHYRIIPELCYDTNATLLFGTDTFLANYARFAHPYDFYSVRYVVAGAEQLKESTRQIWVDKFGIRILEGYGATEASPVLATNTAMHNKAGSVGRLLPGIEHKLETVPGIDEGGRLWVKGPNIMMGYMLTDYPGQILAPKDGWYDTGDIVNIDGEGYITIIGRAKRFAKIAGEMVSLVAIENAVTHLWPGFQHAVISSPDQRKGERLTLVTTCEQTNRDDILRYLKQQQLSELMLPKNIQLVEKMPLLGSGKIDYQATSKLLKPKILS